jgi:hypothetical protein
VFIDAMLTRYLRGLLEQEPRRSPPPTRTAPPRYVDRWGIRGSPHPYVAEHLTGHIFFVSGSLRRLQRLCDRYLNEPNGGQFDYRPMSHLVAMTITRSRTLASRDPAFRRLGLSASLEVTFWVLTAATKRGLLGRTVDHVAWFIPYMFVDNPLALILGRETYGFPKELGRIRMPRTPDEPRPVEGQAEDDPMRYSLKAYALKHFGENEQMDWRLLLEVRRVAAEDERPAMDGLTVLENAVRASGDLLLGGRLFALPGFNLFRSSTAAFARQRIPVVFLKQFYDAACGEYACYQALVETSVQVTALRGIGRLPGRYQLTIHPCDSHPLADDLGLAGEQMCVLSHWAEFDALIDKGESVWEATR